jgi:uncharacterized protein
MIIKREIFKQLQSLSRQFPVVAIMGPRQSGKSTLAKITFPDYAYVSLEELDERLKAKDDPRGFLASYSHRKGVIIDEVQEVPELLSYIQGLVDQEYRPGFFILTGSQHFLMYEKITQTLAGRIALLTLLPLTVTELQSAQLLPSNLDEILIKGFYPRPYVQPIDFKEWCSSYVSTYVEKDVRQVLKITDVLTFQRFLKLCAARVSNLVNFAELARDCDISPHTAKEWISILETSFIIKLLTPYHKNYRKRVIKSPKLYFYDTSLVCSLLGIRTAEELALHPIKGALFESFIISEMFKYNFNYNQKSQIYFWRDTQGHEIDCIIEKSYDTIVPVEIKAGLTFKQDFIKGLIDWKKIVEQPTAPAYVVYGNSDTGISTFKDVFIVGWPALTQMLHNIYTNK